MKSKLKSVFIFFAGAVFSAWIGTFIANPFGDKIISFLTTTPSRISMIILDYIGSSLPHYEVLNANTVWAVVGIGIFFGILFNTFNKIINGLCSEEIENEDSFTETPSAKYSAVIDKFIDFLCAIYEFFQKHISMHFFAFFIAFVFTHITFLFFSAIITTKIATETLGKIEIVSPYVSDLEYKQMKSSFYLIENWEDYEHLDKKLDAIMESEGISLSTK